MKKLKLLLPVMLVMLAVAGCGDDNSDKVDIDIQDYSQEAEGRVIEIDNDQIIFTMDADTTHFSVLNKANGQIWYSNPQNTDVENIATGANKAVLDSTLVVKYSDSKGQDFSYDNFQYSIEKKFFSIEELKDESGKVNGVKVLYTISDIDKAYIPEAITEARMDEFCSKMSEGDAKKIKNYYRRIDINNLSAADDKNSLLAKYPDLAESRVYVLRDNQSDTKLKMFEEIFASAGYNVDEYNYDRERINTETSTGKPMFNVPVCYTIEGGELVVSVPMEEIVYYEQYPITYLTVLPYFGSAGMDEEGYLFVPDGPGGIINFNNGKTGQAAYYNQVYGTDFCQNIDAVVDSSEVSYPLIGIAKDGGSFLCAVEEGSSYSIVEGDVAGRLNCFNSVKFTYTMLHGEDMDISGKSDVTVRNYEDSLPSENIKQRYIFTTSDDYVDMATTYREYIVRTYPTLAEKVDENLSVVLEMVGAVDKKEHVLGVPVTKDLALTGFEDADTMLTELLDSGLSNVSVKYSGWCNNGIHNSAVKNTKFSKKLGSKGDLKSFISNANDKGVDLYMDANFQFVYKNKWFDGFSVNRDAAKFVSREIAELAYFSPTYFAKLPEEYEYYLGSVQFAMDSVDSYSEYISKLGAKNVSFADISTELSANYNHKKHVTREAAMNLITDKYQELAANGAKVMANSDYFYNIPYSDVVTGMTLSNKSFNIIDETIPFYQIALHGIVDYTAESLNLSQNSEETYLKSAELGAGLYYTLTKESAFTLQDTKYTEYFATEYDLWKDTIVEEYNRFANDFNGTYDEYIVDHEKIAENVYKTVFGNGVTVIVNYNYNAFTYNGTQVPARDYIVEGGTN